MGRLKRTIYSRMEEMSFRSGAVASVVTLAVAGTAIALVVTLTGHNAAATAVSGPAAPAGSRPATSAAAPSVAPPAAPVTPPVTPVTSVTRSSSSGVFQPHQPGSSAAPSRTSSPAPLPETRLGPPDRPSPKPRPTSTPTGDPLFPWPFGG